MLGKTTGNKNYDALGVPTWQTPRCLQAPQGTTGSKRRCFFAAESILENEVQHEACRLLVVIGLLEGHVVFHHLLLRRALVIRINGLIPHRGRFVNKARTACSQRRSRVSTKCAEKTKPWVLIFTCCSSRMSVVSSPNTSQADQVVDTSGEVDDDECWLAPPCRDGTSAARPALRHDPARFRA